MVRPCGVSRRTVSPLPMPLVHPRRYDEVNERIGRLLTTFCRGSESAAVRRGLCDTRRHTSSPLQWSSLPSSSAIAGVAEQVQKEYNREWNFRLAAARSG